MSEIKVSIRILFIIITLFFSYNILAQSNSEDELDDKDNLHSFDIMFINSYSIGYNVILNNSNAIRILLDLGLSKNSDNQDGTYTYTNNSATDVNKSTTENQAGYYSLKLSGHYLSNLYSDRLGEVYFGIGPELGYSNQENSSKNKDENNNDEYNYSTKEYSLGILGLLGIRSKLTNSISIFVETHLKGGKSWSVYDHTSKYNSNDYVSISHTKRDGNGWYYSYVWAKVGLRFSI
ncbi:MAG: hypothetical protein KDC88_10880 [Ignavibacteriae bacterium]|nr:hypothetical protein [Ignavibacteriota bacterium]MCB9209587.1 hypothetical protein [Ignavibacteriales bacterium]